MRGRVADSTRALGQVFANPDLRRLQLAWARVADRQLDVLRRALGLRLRPGRRRRRSASSSVLRMIPAAIASPFLATPRRPLPAQARDDRDRPRPGGADDRRRGRDDLAGLVGVRRLRDRRPLHRRGHGIPAGPGGAPPPPRAQPGRADRRERRLEHARGRRRLRRPGARRPPARGHERRDGLRRQRPLVRLVGAARARGARRLDAARRTRPREPSHGHGAGHRRRVPGARSRAATSSCSRASTRRRRSSRAR